MSLKHQASLEIFLGLAPQLALQTQPPQRQQQARITRVLFQPALGRLQLARGVAPTQQAIEAYQAAVIAALERRMQ
ncbi:hypothetical protein FQZ97_995230 [compost metagenome]